MPMCRHAPAKRVGRPSTTLSRGHGTGARLKYSAPPSGARSAFTQLVSRNSSWDEIGATAVAISTCGRALNASAISPIIAAGIMGSSPCRFTTISSAAKARARATSAIRSVPEACLGEVIRQSAPKRVAESKMRTSSVAMITDAAPLARAHCHTHWIRGLSPMASSGFPGRREAEKRAGMMTWNMRLGYGLAVEQGIVGAQCASLLRQHQRNPLAHGVGQPIRPAHELELIAGTGSAQGSFANWTHQQVEQSLIHNYPRTRIARS